MQKYKGIVFMDKNGNIINDNDNRNADDNDALEITGVDETHTNNDNTSTEIDITNNNNNTLEITGVYNNTGESETTIESQNDNNEPYLAPHTHMNNEQDDTGHNQDRNHEQYYDKISIEDESPKDMHITINDINTVHEMNAGQLHVDPDTREEMETEIEMDTPTHRYDLRPRPMKRNQQLQHGQHWTTINYCQTAPTCNVKSSRHKRGTEEVWRGRQ